MRKIFLFLMILLFWLALSAKGLEKAKIREIEKIVQAEVKHDLFSGNVLVASDGKVVYARSFGEASKEYRVPNKLETRFNISSIQKTFIAVLIMQLHQEGKISLSDTLNKYLPKCPYKTAGQIRIKHLLNHTSGLGDYRRSKEYQKKAADLKTIEDVLPLVYKDQPTFGPGEKFKYSNSGMFFLKIIIQKVTSKKLKQVLQERIFSPLGMGQTVLFVGGDILANRATGHTIDKNGKQYRRVIDEPSAYGGGGIYATVLDLLKFDQALYGEQLLNQKNKKIMFTPVKPSRFYAYGWIVVPFAGTTVIYHGGSSGGYTSEFRRYPEKGYTIIVLSNFETGAFELANKLDCMLLGEDYLVASKAEFYYRRGQLLHHRHKDYNLAYQFLQKALNPELLSKINQSLKHRIEREINVIGYAYLAMGDYENAIKIFKSNVKHFPRSINVYDSLGDAYRKKGNTALAIKYYKEALKLNPRKTNREQERYRDISEKINKLTKKR